MGGNISDVNNGDEVPVVGKAMRTWIKYIKT